MEPKISEEDLETRLYELNCANAEWHESTGKNITSAYRRFSRALRWFQDRDIAVRYTDNPTHCGVYVLNQQAE